MLWGAFFILSPAEILIFGIVVWLPLLVWRERERASVYGWNPGFKLRALVVMCMIGLAVIATPNKLDLPKGPFQKTEWTLAELATAGLIYGPMDRAHDSIRVQLPSKNPTPRQIMDAITQQTGFPTRVRRCLSGSTIVFGESMSAVYVNDWNFTNRLKPADVIPPAQEEKR